LYRARRNLTHASSVPLRLVMVNAMTSRLITWTILSFFALAAIAVAESDERKQLSFSEPTALTTGKKTFTSVAFSNNGSNLVAIEDQTSAFDMFYPRFRGKSLIFDVATQRVTEKPIPPGKENYTRVIQVGGQLNDNLADDDVLSIVGPWPLLVRDEKKPRSHEVKLVAVRSGAVLAKFPYKEDVASWELAIAPDQKLLAVCGGGATVANENDLRGRIQLWNLETAETHFEHKTSGLWFGAIAFSPDGRKFATGAGYPSWGAFLRDPKHIYGGYSDGEVSIWDSANGEVLHTSPRLEGLDGNPRRWVESVLFSPDNETLVSAESWGTITWWSVATGKQLRSVQMQRPERKDGESYAGPRVLSLNWLDSGRYLLVSVGSYNRGGSWGELRVLDNASGSVREVVLKKQPKPIDAVAVSNDGKQIAAAVLSGDLKIWKVISE
jgi:WD40 repeat protein